MRIRPSAHLFALSTLVSLSLVFAFAGCSESNNESGGSSAGGSAAAGGGTNTGTVGGATGVGGSTATGPGVWSIINVDLNAATSEYEATTAVQGFAKDATPLAESFATTKTAGSCRVLEPISPFCDPKCASSQSCSLPCAATETCKPTDTSGSCVAKPTAVGMGTLKFKGLTLAAGGTEFDLAPIATTTYQAAGATKVAYPPCTAGAEVTVTGGADTATAFSLKSSCIEQLALTGDNPLPFKQNEAAKVTWTPSTTSGGAKVTVRIDISHHGGLKGLILCDSADTGSLDVDATLVTYLISLGTAGFPEARVTRINAASGAAGSGKATLNIQSSVARPLAIPGITSCHENGDCPSTQTCSTLKCQTVPCTTNAQCIGQTCKDSTCQSVACTSHAACSGQSCLNSVCQDVTCSTDDDCTGGQTCQNSSCK